ncbi:Intraflagellar transport protein 57, variant 2 [Schistosoma haematobium]|uniref:Intraflagellar transport protein 57, variant 2 n=1 Tax=Schistosoma haematobium TaxID=6185 RepID=A0A922LRF1_SCHHA|nr:Intraflagellar transport protein 57, variant 2 [Schistosoma haematobium]KAH9591761.1 Intraflagellar transport protein 57, variant 2 [Schistosoma haematobium]
MLDLRSLHIYVVSAKLQCHLRRSTKELTGNGLIENMSHLINTYLIELPSTTQALLVQAPHMRVNTWQEKALIKINVNIKLHFNEKAFLKLQYFILKFNKHKNLQRFSTILVC